jgi:hypothetical protein
MKVFVFRDIKPNGVSEEYIASIFSKQFCSLLVSRWSFACCAF